MKEFSEAPMGKHLLVNKKEKKKKRLSSSVRFGFGNCSWLPTVPNTIWYNICILMLLHRAL